MDPEPSQALSVNQSIEQITQKLDVANLALRAWRH
jgi:hypothetical protein